MKNHPQDWAPHTSGNDYEGTPEKINEGGKTEGGRPMLLSDKIDGINQEKDKSELGPSSHFSSLPSCLEPQFLPPAAMPSPPGSTLLTKP